MKYFLRYSKSATIVLLAGLSISPLVLGIPAPVLWRYYAVVPTESGIALSDEDFLSIAKHVFEAEQYVCHSYNVPYPREDAPPNFACEHSEDGTLAGFGVRRDLLTFSLSKLYSRRPFSRSRERVSEQLDRSVELLQARFECAGFQIMPEQQARGFISTDR